MAVRVYREKMHEFAAARLSRHLVQPHRSRRVLEMVEKKHRKTASTQLARVQQRDRLRAFAKLTEVVDGERRIVHDPPLIFRLEKHECRHAHG